MTASHGATFVRPRGGTIRKSRMVIEIRVRTRFRPQERELPHRAAVRLRIDGLTRTLHY
jgi:hypothetical protein